MSIRVPYRYGITMAETIVSTLVVGFVLVGTLQIVGPMVRSNSVHADRLVAANLANELTQEISIKHFTDPDNDTIDAIGLDSGERSYARQDFDDVDDYDGWSANPPKLSTSQTNNFLGRWTRSVKVVHVQMSDVNIESATNTGLKLIRVIVSKDGVEHARVYSLQSQSSDSLGFIVEGGG